MTFKPGARLNPKRVRGVRTPFRNLRRRFRRPYRAVMRRATGKGTYRPRYPR